MKTKQTVDEFVTSLNHPQELLINQIRAAIKTAAPGLVEGIKWNAPSYALAGNDIITFNFRTFDGVALIFHTGPKGKDTHTGQHLFEDETGLLEWLADKRAVLKTADSQTFEAQAQAFDRLVKIWVGYAEKGF